MVIEEQAGGYTNRQLLEQVSKDQKQLSDKVTKLYVKDKARNTAPQQENSNLSTMNGILL